MKRIQLTILSVLFVLLTGADHMRAQGTAFTYQGRLQTNGTPVTGLYELRCAVFDVSGLQVGPTITNLNVGVTNGLFTTLLDFGPVFGDRSQFLEIAVRPAGSPNVFQTLSPRQFLASAPKANFAYNAAQAVTANILVGYDPSAFWMLGGNSNQAPSSYVLGTLDNNALELKANGVRGLRIEPTAVGINFIAGNANNSIAPNSVISTIGGGQLNTIEGSAFGSTIAGGDINTIRASAAESVISGGIQNIIGSNSLRAVIAGGLFNRIGSNATYSVISGGRNNRITNDSAYATISGGWNNVIETASAHATISGGSNNVIGALSEMATIGGGIWNKIGPSAPYGGTISGGYSNTIADNTYQSVIAGGVLNSIGGNSDRGVIGGGGLNTIMTNVSGAVIAGGFYNVASNYISIGGYSTIGGGYQNVVDRFDSTVPGGAFNEALADYSFAAGYNARAHHEGTFVWSEPPTNLMTQTDIGMESTGKYQFLIRATGGVGIGVNAPQQQLSVATGMNIDQNNWNDGTVSSSLTFGSGSGEAIGSKRTPGGNQYGLDFYSNFAKRMSILNNGNVGIGTDAPQQRLHVIGNILASGTITPNSDRNLKTDFAPVDAAAVLDKVARLPIQQWRFKSEPEEVKHVGPTAQDFRAAFGLGEIPTAIATVDADGVALAAIQGLNQKVEDQRTELKTKEAEMRALKQRLEKLEKMIFDKPQLVNDQP